MNKTMLNITIHNWRADALHGLQVAKDSNHKKIAWILEGKIQAYNEILDRLPTY